MSIYQTKIWIWTFAYERCWKEAKCYAQEFERYGIDGKRLPMLTDKALELMSIRNIFHQKTILEKIKTLFPVCTLSDISSVRSSSVRDIEDSSSDGLDERQSSEGMETSSTSLCAQQCSGMGLSSSSNISHTMECSLEPKSENTATSLRTRKLSL